MREDRLLERISRWEDGRERSHLTSAELLVSSVLRHLQRVLNTRQGSVGIDERYGVPDFTNLAGSFTSGSAKDIETEIRAVIERCEPRLKSAQINLVAEGRDVLSLKFELSGIIEADEREIPVHLSTVVNSDGKVSISR